MKSEIVAVDAALAAREFASAHENESEAVALAIVELLFIETNAHYTQHKLARRTVQRLADHLAGNVIDAVFAAVLPSETPIEDARFHSEASPEASAQDRHAVRALPHRTPDGKQHRDGLLSSPGKLPAAGGGGGNGASSPSRDSKGSSSPEKLAAGGTNSSSLVRARRKAAEKVPIERTVSHLVIPDILELPIEDDEPSDTKAWRSQCLRELTQASRKPSLSKWATVARAFAPQSSSSDAKTSMEVEIIESTPPLLLKELEAKSALSASGSASSIKMKTNVDSFSTVVDLLPSSSSSIPAMMLENGGDDHLPPHSSRNHWAQLTRGSSTMGSSMQLGALASSTTGKKAKGVMTTAKKSNGALHLNDKLSRKRSIMGNNNSNGIGNGAANSGKLLWKYERDGTRGGDNSQPFTPEVSDFNATALPSTIQLASGVVLSQGESLVEGPTRIESPTTMSKKRFDLHQSLATDLMLHWSECDETMSLPSSASSPSLYSHHNYSHPSYSYHSDSRLKPYVEVPAEPIPAPPHLSPISASSLVIPQTHFAQSLSTPALRVRSPTNNNNGLPPSTSFSSAIAATALSNSSSHADLSSKHRPRTALLMGKQPLVSKIKPGTARIGSAGPTTSTAVGATNIAPAKYLREFPKPQPGVVKLSKVDDSQRLAWISS